MINVRAVVCQVDTASGLPAQVNCIELHLSMWGGGGGGGASHR